MASTLVPKTRIPWRHLVLFGWMPGFLKKFAYRSVLGYKIGRRVSLSFGSVVIGDSVTLGDDVEIGLMAVVQGRSITIGRHSSIGTFTYVSCETIEIGEDAKIREQVFIGGPQLPESRFTLGSRTIVLQMTYINPTKPVTIGDDTGIGGHCLIFTHGVWLNALDGYPVTYEPVTIGKSVWLPWRVFVMPGATIGDGSVIGGDSLVQGTIPPKSLAVGSPAKVIRSAPDFPRGLSAEQQRDLVTGMVSEFERYVTHAGVTVALTGDWRSYTREGTTARLLWRRVAGATPALRRDDTVLSEVALSDADRSAFRSAGVHWLDLAGRTRSVGGSPLTEELALFLGRYGIRLARDV
jgi:acetyltransferase-like isoleucine patch superfamily enzyme